MSAARVIVVGSVNIDLVATVARLRGPGETVTGGTFSQHHGGKGGNQAVAAARLVGLALADAATRAVGAAALAVTRPEARVGMPTSAELEAFPAASSAD